MSNPFSEPAQGGSAKMVFGTYKLTVNGVDLVSGYAGYTDPRYLDKDGNAWNFKGKQLNPKSKNFHIVQDLTLERKDGTEYVAFRDWMYWEKDVCYKAAYPSHKKLFGDDLAGIFGKTAEVQAEEVEVDDKGYSRKCYKIVKVFKNKAERQKAREAYFSQFAKDSNGHADEATNEIAFSDAMITVFKKNAAKGAAFIVENLVDDEIIATHGKDVITAKITELIA